MPLSSIRTESGLNDSQGAIAAVQRSKKLSIDHPVDFALSFECNELERSALISAFELWANDIAPITL